MNKVKSRAQSFGNSLALLQVVFNYFGAQLYKLGKFIVNALVALYLSEFKEF